jgi:hypothetical protein
MQFILSRTLSLLIILFQLRLKDRGVWTSGENYWLQTCFFASLLNSLYVSKRRILLCKSSSSSASKKQIILSYACKRFQPHSSNLLRQKLMKEAKMGLNFRCLPCQSIFGLGVFGICLWEVNNITIITWSSMRNPI